MDFRGASSERFATCGQLVWHVLCLAMEQQATLADSNGVHRSPPHEHVFSRLPILHDAILIMELKTMISKFLSALTFVLSIVALTGCISIPRQEFVKSANENIKKIAIIQAEPSELRVVNFGGASGAFGLIGAAIAAADQESKSSDFTREMSRQNLTMGKQLGQTVEAQLRTYGYDVTLLSNQRPVVIDEAESQFDYSKITTDADAILHVWFAGVGYVSPPDSTQYIPQVGVRARLVSAKTRTQLFYQAFMYGWKVNIENMAYVPADAKYAYDDFDALMSRSSEAAEGLQNATSAISMRIGYALK